MELGKLMADILVYVSYKFEMNNFEMAQVIGKNVPLAFLYVYVMINSFSVELRRNFTVRNMKEIPVFVQSSELSIRTYLYVKRIIPLALFMRSVILACELSTI